MSFNFDACAAMFSRRINPWDDVFLGRFDTAMLIHCDIDLEFAKPPNEPRRVPSTPLIDLRLPLCRDMQQRCVSESVRRFLFDVHLAGVHIVDGPYNFEPFGLETFSQIRNSG